MQNSKRANNLPVRVFVIAFPAPEIYNKKGGSMRKFVVVFLMVLFVIPGY
jgi:hypothetical protein